MTDNLRIDSQKLNLHPERVAKWVEGKDIAPIYIEVCPTSICNHRCIFCSFDYLDHKDPIIDKNALNNFIKQAAAMKVKSIMYAGEGEPMVHGNIAEIIHNTKMAGIDAAMTTNGVLFTEEKTREMLPDLSWVKFSIDAADAQTHAFIHGCSMNDFPKLINNIKFSVAYKKEKKLSCTIGTQILMLPENADQVYDAAKLMKQIGVDYFVVKPFTKHPMEKSDFRGTIKYDDQDKLKRKLEKLNGNGFSAIYRENAMSKLGHIRPYNACYSYRFWAYLDCKGDLYACSTFLGNQDYCYGNIRKETLQEIWTGKRRQEVIERMSKIDINHSCREICRMDEINRYLWELKNPSSHANFI